MGHKASKTKKYEGLNGPSASDDDIAFSHLPGVSVAEEAKRAQLLEDMFVSTNRAGAGGTKAGLVGIRPHGMEGSKLLEEMTPGRVKPRAESFSTELGDPKGGKNENAKKPKIMLPRNFCPDCDRTNRPHKGGCVNVSSFDQPMPELNLKPNEVMVSYFCQACLEKHRLNNSGPGAELDMVMPDGSVYKNKQIKNAERLLRVRENTKAYIRANLNNPDIYTEGLDDGAR